MKKKQSKNLNTEGAEEFSINECSHSETQLSFAQLELPDLMGRVFEHWTQNHVGFRARHLNIKIVEEPFEWDLSPISCSKSTARPQFQHESYAIILQPQGTIKHPIKK